MIYCFNLTILPLVSDNQGLKSHDLSMKYIMCQSNLIRYKASIISFTKNRYYRRNIDNISVEERYFGDSVDIVSCMQ